MTSRPSILLVNPPLWNVYAPHLAVPLLTAVLRERGWPVRAYDLSAAYVRHLLSGEGVAELPALLDRAGERGLDPEAVDEARLLLPSVVREVDGARLALSSDLGVLHDHVRFRAATRTLGNALVCHSAAYPDFTCDLRSNRQYYSERSTASVLAAVRDPVRNPYRQAFDRLLPGQLTDPRLGLVGISVSADTQLIAAMTAAAIVRELRPDVRIVMGGNYITRVAGRWTARHPFFDLVDDFVLYEGEDALVALCEHLFEDGPGKVPGRGTLDAGGRLSFAPPLDVDLATLPAPDFGDYDLTSYLSPSPVLPVSASRSCAWNCAFCSIPFASNRYRYRDADTVVDEMTLLARRYGATSFMFVDEILTQRTLRQVSEALVRRDAGLHWYGETRFSAGIDRDLARQLHASGCRRLDLGLESYNQRVLDLMAKGTQERHIRPCVDALLGAGIPVHLFCISGFPGETEDEARRTAEFAEQTLRRSRNEYGLPYSTSVNSPFILDLLSPVGTHPERFGVRVVPPPPEEDLALDADYTVESGIDGRTAGALATAADPMPDVSATAPLRHRGLVGESEEYAFLRCVHDSGLPAGRPAERALVLDPPAGAPLRLADDVAWQVSGHDASVGLYTPSSDSILRLDGAWAGLVRTLASGSTLREAAAAAGPGDGRTSPGVLLCSLWTLGLLHVPTEAVRPLPATADEHLTVSTVTGWRESVDAESGQATLTHDATGRQVALNVHAFLLWRACAEPGPRPAEHWSTLRDMGRVELVQFHGAGLGGGAAAAAPDHGSTLRKRKAPV
ncbi:radical SAM protein [Streptomyces sp. NL15-2K]|uniref:B12-binding domain-containing radical SAM protein n=1 Tax=Streptomyces sp. NL15-2K TaxID=376149 RepID=UPI000F55FCEA|nr:MULTISPECIES: radical SAM protein [Actinomycetes]WKX09529.1 radical SAM protein [Kutzneria buriramensis]GCB48958.1 radical SAM domain protein [Streptomyces sp. NL15-2K]